MDTSFPIWALVVVALVALACLLTHIFVRRTFVTPENIRNKASEGYSQAAPLIVSSKQRRSLKQYLTDYASLFSDSAQKSLTNFHIHTVNATGLFFPARDGVYSPDAVRFAVKGGARAFVLDIWPSMEPHQNFRPILQAVEEGSNWRRISMNSLAVETAIEAIVSEVFTESLTQDTSFRDDVVILYFRFHGHPRMATYDALAKSCAELLEPYRLDPSFAGFRGDSRIHSTAIDQFAGKVILVTNKTKKQMDDEYKKEALEKELSTTKNPLIPYMNLGPRDTIPVEVDLNALDRTESTTIESSLVFTVPDLNSTMAETNNWGALLETAKNKNIHCLAMNVFAPDASQGYADFLFKGYFRTYSYYLKESGSELMSMELTEPTTTGNTRVGESLSTPGIGMGNLAHPPR